MVFLMPLNSAHAAGGTVALSASSGTVGSFVTITGSGFTPGADVAIEFGTTIINTFGPGAGYPTVATMLDTTGAGLASPAPLGITCSSATGLVGFTPGPCIETDANGFFSAIVAVPPTVNGVQTVTANDGTVTGTTTFTVNANILISTSGTSYSAISSALPDEVYTGLHIVATGFAASDTVAFTAAVFAGPNGGTTTPISSTAAAGTASATPTPGSASGVSRSGVLYLSGPGVATSSTTSLTVSDVLGGKQTIVGTGTSGVTGQATFTINPAIAFYSTESSATAYTMGAAANQAIYFEGYGFTPGTVAANSITVGGTAVVNSPITIGSMGNFGVGGGAHLYFSAPSGGLTAGASSVVIVDGSSTFTFNYASHNIVVSTNNGAHATDSAGNGIPLNYNQPGCSVSGGTCTQITSVTGQILWGYGSPFIVSTSGTAGTFATATTDSSTYSPNAKAFVTVFGSGFLKADPTTTVGSITPTGGTALSATKGSVSAGTDTSGAIVTDPLNGAFWDILTGTAAGLGTSCSGTAATGMANTLAGTTNCLNEEPTSISTTASTYVIPVTGATVSGVNQPTLGVNPWISLSSTKSSTTATISFGTGNGASAWPTITFHGFAYNTVSDVCSLAAGSISLPLTSCVIGSNGVASAVVITNTPDLPGGSNTLTGTDGIVSGTATVFILPNDINGAHTALSAPSGTATSTTIVRTGTNFGVHGLLASTSYTIVWDPTEATETALGTFTSTSTGQIPAPGVQVTIPSGQSGNHLIGLKTASGTYTFFNAVSASTISSTATETAGPASCTTACSPDASNNAFSSQVTTITGQYQDGIFVLTASLTAIPTVANIGGSVGLTGLGLPGATTFELGMSMAGTNNAGSPGTAPSSAAGFVPSTCNSPSTGAQFQFPAQPSVVLGSFTSTSSGAVPASTSVSLSDAPTIAGLEQGTLYCIFAQTATNFGSGAPTGTAKFLLQASGSNNMTSAPSGHNVIMTAHALASGGGYNILFAPYALSNGNIVGTVVGALLANQNGAGSATFTVPSVIQSLTGSQPVVSGATYNVELQPVGGVTQALASPPTLSIGSVNTSSCNTTTCLVANGSPAITTIGANKAVETSFTNNSNAPVTAIVYAVVHNALGQTVSYSTATITANAGASASGYDVLFGLAPGTYSVTIFATSTSGTAISTSSTVSVTI